MIENIAPFIGFLILILCALILLYFAPTDDL